MKKVIECDSCGFYNIKIKIKCSRCGNRLDGLPKIEVEDNLIENPNFGRQVQENEFDEDKIVEIKREGEQEQGIFKCATCGEKNTIPANKNSVYCITCRRPVTREAEKWVDGNADVKTTSINEINLEKGAEKSFSFVSDKGSFVLTFTAESQVFGRGSCTEELICNNKFISRKHIRYFYSDGQAYIEDISSNGTFINGEMLSRGRKYELKVGDYLKLSNEEFVIKDVD